MKKMWTIIILLAVLCFGMGFYIYRNHKLYTIANQVKTENDSLKEKGQILSKKADQQDSIILDFKAELRIITDKHIKDSIAHENLQKQIIDNIADIKRYSNAEASRKLSIQLQSLLRK